MVTKESSWYTGEVPGSYVADVCAEEVFACTWRGTDKYKDVLRLKSCRVKPSLLSCGIRIVLHFIGPVLLQGNNVIMNAFAGK
jgi:hypothetical protein